MLYICNMTTEKKYIKYISNIYSQSNLVSTHGSHICCHKQSARGFFMFSYVPNNIIRVVLLKFSTINKTSRQYSKNNCYQIWNCTITSKGGCSQNSCNVYPDNRTVHDESRMSNSNVPNQWLERVGFATYQTKGTIICNSVRLLYSDFR